MEAFFKSTSFPLIICAGILFLAWVFAKKFADLLAKGVAESLFIRESESIKAEFRAFTNRQSVVFVLEKETLAEFNEAINAWLLVEMSSKTLNYEYNQLAAKFKSLRDSHNKVQICFAKLSLIVVDEDLFIAAKKSFQECTQLWNFYVKGLRKLKSELFNEYEEGQNLRKIHEDLDIENDDEREKKYEAERKIQLELIKEIKAKVKEVEANFKEEFPAIFDRAQTAIAEFAEAGRAYFKKNY